jgi:hypothetical protein
MVEPSVFVVRSPAASAAAGEINATFQAGTIREKIGSTSIAPSDNVQTKCRIAAEARRKPRVNRRAENRKKLPLKVVSKRSARPCPEKPQRD